MIQFGHFSALKYTTITQFAPISSKNSKEMNTQHALIPQNLDMQDSLAKG